MFFYIGNYSSNKQLPLPVELLLIAKLAGIIRRNVSVLPNVLLQVEKTNKQISIYATLVIKELNMG